jgi:hypothetical protein
MLDKFGLEFRVVDSALVKSLRRKQGAVADGQRLLVSSANLAELALNFDMEFGLLVAGGDIPRRVEEHFDALIASVQLVRLPRDAQ